MALNDLPAIDAEIDEMLEADPTGEKGFGHLKDEGQELQQRPDPRPLFRLGEPGSMAKKQQIMRDRRRLLRE